MIQILCPDASQKIKVASGSGSVAAGTICVHGDNIEAFFSASEDLAVIVRVRVVQGFNAPQPSLTFNPSTDRDAAMVGTTWCAKSVPVPAGTASGDGLTVFAWFPDSVGSGGTGTAQKKSFFAGGSGDKDCCADAPCGSGSGGPGPLLVGQLASVVELEITVPSGRHAGAYRAIAVSVMTWHVTIGGVPYRLVCAEGETLTLHGPTSSAPSRSFETDPFSATFPGELFDADDEIVVVVA